MSTVTISKKEYEKLLDQKLRFEYLRQIIEGDIFASPPTKSRKKIIGAFRNTKRYNGAFLASLERGLRRSSYFR